MSEVPLYTSVDEWCGNDERSRLKQRSCVFEPSLTALSLRSDVISSINILSLCRLVEMGREDLALPHLQIVLSDAAASADVAVAASFHEDAAASADVAAAAQELQSTGPPSAPP